MRLRTSFFLFMFLLSALWCTAESVLVRFDRLKTDKTFTLRHSLLKTGARISRTFPNLGWESWEPPPGISNSAFLASLKDIPGIENACLSSHYRLCDTFPDDPDFLTWQWPLYSPTYPENDIDAPQAWDITTGTTEVVVAVIDTGVEITHPDIISNLWHNPGEIPDNGIDDDENGYIDDIIGWDFCNNTPHPFDPLGHGTHVSGIIGAKGNNAIGITGVCWNVSLMPLKVFEEREATVEVILGAIDYILGLDCKVNIINASWGGEYFSPPLYDAIFECRKRGILFVNSAGNEKLNTTEHPKYPACFNLANIISVGSTDLYGNLMSNSNYGPFVSICAPGTNIYSTLTIPSYYGKYSGTSMAAPHVSGAAALLLSVHPDLKPYEIRNRIIGCAKQEEKWKTNCLSQGIVNLPNLFSDDPPAPASINDLTVIDTGITTVTLEFSLPYDNDSGSWVKIVEIRYARFPLSDESWWRAEPVPVIIEKGSPGEKRSVLVEGLFPGALYFFGARSLDECGLQSPTSNSAFAYTRKAEVVFVEDFEKSITGWDLSGSYWDIATSPGIALSGDHFLFHPELPSGYEKIEMDAAVSPWIDLEEIKEPYLAFACHYEFFTFINTSNKGIIDIISEGSDSWEEIAQFTFFYSPWKRETFYLGNWRGCRIRIRFRFSSQISYSELGDTIGWMIDDIKILDPGILGQNPSSIILF